MDISSARIISAVLALAVGAGLIAGHRAGPRRLQAWPSRAAAAPLQQATPVVDQTTCNEPWAGQATVDRAVWKAQTFVAGTNGRLAMVDLPGTNRGGTTLLHLRLTGGCGGPVGGDVAVATATRGNRFIFDDPPLLRAASLYALVLSHQGSGSFAWAYSNRPDCYAHWRGTSYTSGNGETWSADTDDIHFTTWMIPDEVLPSATPSLPPSPTHTPWPTLPPGATPYLILDQETCPEAPVASVNITGDTWKAQTFVAGASGTLRYVVLPGAHVSGATTLHLRSTDVGHAPMRADLAFATVDCGTVFAFDPGVRIEAGRIYALCVSSSAASGGFWWGYSGSASCYPNPIGTSHTSLDGGQTWSRDVLDIHFSTFVVPDTPVGPPATPPASAGCRRPLAADEVESYADPAREDAALRQAAERLAERPEPAMRRSVIVISLPTGAFQPEPLLKKSRDLAALVAEASAYHGYKDPDAKPSLTYTIYQDKVFLEPAMPPRCGRQAYDLGYFYDKYDICTLVRRGEVDEVWLWEGGTGGLPEWAMGGPEWGAELPNCGRQVALMAFHNSMDLGYALHSMGHRMEGTMRQYRPCDFSSATWPWPQAPAGCRDGTASDRTGFVARPFAGNDLVGACGDVHTPPNIPQGVSGEYVYGSRLTARSICEDWRRDGRAEVKTIDCGAWGCTQTGFMLWWFQNIPGLDNASRDRTGAPMPSWWPLFAGRPTPPPTGTPPTATSPPPSATPTTPPTGTPTPTGSPAPSRTRTPTATAIATAMPTATPEVRATAGTTALDRWTIALPWAGTGR